MQHVQNSQIIYLIVIEIASFDKIHMSQSRDRIRKLPAPDHMTHVVKIDILTGHEEMGICILF